MRLLATQLKAKREARGLSQEQAAELLGVDKETLSRWERGRNKPTGAAVLQKIKNEYLVSQQEIDNWFLDWHSVEQPRKIPYKISGYEILHESGIDEHQLLEKLIDLDTNILPDIVLQDEGTAEQWGPIFHASPLTWRVISFKKEIVGYWHYLCLKDEYFEQVKSGQLRDANIKLNMIEFPSYLKTDKAYKMYIVMIGIHAAHQNVTAGSILLKSFVNEIEAATKNNVFFSEIAAVAYTPQGISLCNDFGMEFLCPHVSKKNAQIAEVYHIAGARIAHNGYLSKNPTIATAYLRKFSTGRPLQIDLKLNKPKY